MLIYDSLMCLQAAHYWGDTLFYELVGKQATYSSSTPETNRLSLLTT